MNGWRVALALFGLPALLALAACSGGGAQANAGTEIARAQVEHGRELFRNKGCVTCHQNDRVEGETGIYGIGPNLTDYRNDAEFLRQWLADPGEVRPNTQMPDLDLSAEEIEALIAFLNEPR
jgi:cytochrome c2